MSAPVSLEEYVAQRVRDWAEQPRDLSHLGKMPTLRDPDQIIIRASDVYPTIDDDTVELSADYEPEVMSRMPGIRSFSDKENGMQFNLNADGGVTGYPVEGRSERARIGLGSQQQDIIRSVFPIIPETKVLGHSHNAGDSGGSYSGPYYYIVVQEKRIPSIIVHGATIIAVEKVGGRMQARILSAEGLSREDRKKIQLQIDHFQKEIVRRYSR